MTVDLSKFKNTDFDRGRFKITEMGWRLVSALFFQNPLFPFYAPKRFLLRMFGAKIGKGVLIKPRVMITFPWKLKIGDHSWVGEEVWLHSLDQIEIGSNACISQRAFLCTGSHNSRSKTFDLKTSPIYVGDGVWVGAGALIAPGVRLGRHCFVTMGSVVTSDVKDKAIVTGNPATFQKERVID